MVVAYVFVLTGASSSLVTIAGGQGDGRRDVYSGVLFFVAIWVGNGLKTCG